MKCPHCGKNMTLFGVTDKGVFKYVCNMCARIEIKTEKKKSDD